MLVKCKLSSSTLTLPDTSQMDSQPSALAGNRKSVGAYKDFSENRDLSTNEGSSHSKSENTPTIMNVRENYLPNPDKDSISNKGINNLSIPNIDSTSDKEFNTPIINVHEPSEVSLAPQKPPSNSGLGIKPSRLLTRKSLNNLNSRPLRNTKNLSLNLNGISNNQADEINTAKEGNFLNNNQSNTIMSPLSALPFRKTLLKDSNANNLALRNKLSQANLNSKISNQSVKMPPPKLTRRRTMLSLSIPNNIDKSPSLSSASVTGSNRISSLQIQSSPNSPMFNHNGTFANGNSNTALANKDFINSASSERTVLSDESSNYGEDELTSVIYKSNDESYNNNANFSTQTILQDFSKLTLNDNFDENKLNAYPQGPVDIYDQKLYLYSEPTYDQIQKFDVVINVAKEIPFPGLAVSEFDDTASFKILQPRGNNTDKIYQKINSTPDYYYVPWTHTSKLCNDFPVLTKIIDDAVSKNKKVLVHCQCGVSRSASLIIAYIMKLKKLILTEAYTFVKNRANDISPNMTLIFQLMEWGDLIGCGVAKSPGYYDPKYRNKQLGEPERAGSDVSDNTNEHLKQDDNDESKKTITVPSISQPRVSSPLKHSSNQHNDRIKPQTLSILHPSLHLLKTPADSTFTFNDGSSAYNDGRIKTSTLQLPATGLRDTNGQTPLQLSFKLGDYNGGPSKRPMPHSSLQPLKTPLVSSFGFDSDADDTLTIEEEGESEQLTSQHTNNNTNMLTDYLSLAVPKQPPIKHSLSAPTSSDPLHTPAKESFFK